MNEDQDMSDNGCCVPPLKPRCERRAAGGASGCGAVYGLGLIGAAVYWISHAAGFWAGVLGLLKAFVWPAFLVYEALKYLQM